MRPPAPQALLRAAPAPTDGIEDGNTVYNELEELRRHTDARSINGVLDFMQSGERLQQSVSQSVEMTAVCTKSCCASGCTWQRAAAPVLLLLPVLPACLPVSAFGSWTPFLHACALALALQASALLLLSRQAST